MTSEIKSTGERDPLVQLRSGCPSPPNPIRLPGMRDAATRVSPYDPDNLRPCLPPDLRI